MYNGSVYFVLFLYIQIYNILFSISRVISNICRNMSKSKIINIRISPELKKAAKKIAEEDGRSLSNWVTRLIEKEIKKARRAFED